MRQLNVNDFYLLGKRLEELEKELKTEEPIPLSRVFWHLFVARNLLNNALAQPCALLQSSQRAAKSIVDRITGYIPEAFDEIFNVDQSQVHHPYQFRGLLDSISAFETVLSNDMPEMSTFAVSQIGILRTDDLINASYRQIAEPLRKYLKEKAKADLIQAGKCLAFRVSTASAFHACRAIETGIDQYYEAVAGKPYQVSPNGGNNNWGAKTDALVKLGADEKVTEFLTHIRKQYRNPVTHPDVVVDEHEAVDLFVASLSAISMMLGAVKSLEEFNQPLLKGLVDASTDPMSEVGMVEVEKLLSGGE